MKSLSSQPILGWLAKGPVLSCYPNPRPWLFQSRGFACHCGMHREVCLKHRKNRRERSCGCVLEIGGSGVCSFCQITCGAGAHISCTRAAHSRPSSRSRIPERHSGDAGATPADRSNFQNTQLQYTPHGGRQLAQLGLQNLACSGQHRDAVPLSLQSRGRQVGRPRSHTPLRAGSTPAPAIHFPWAGSKCSRMSCKQPMLGALPSRSTIFKTGAACPLADAQRLFQSGKVDRTTRSALHNRGAHSAGRRSGKTQEVS